MSLREVDLFGTNDKVATAISRIRAFCQGKRTLVAFSGGKDSQCCYHLCQDAGIDFVAQYSITRFEPPELIHFIRANYPDVVFRRAYTMSLIDEIEKNGLPNRWFRWCCNCKHKKTLGFDISVVGVRASESFSRASNWRIFGQRRDRSFYVCPIFDWTASDVWEYLNSKGLPHCSLYDEGFKRIGCVCCPLSPSTMRSQSFRWPKISDMLFLGHCKNWQRALAFGGKTTRGKSFRMLEFKTPLASFEHWLDCGMTIKTSIPVDDQPCLFAGTGFSESDFSVGEN